jgi:hypothetical protein
MSEDRPPPEPKKTGGAKKPLWLLKQEERQKQPKLEGQAGDFKEKDATAMFSRSKDSYNLEIRATQKRKEEKRNEKKHKPVGEDAVKSKRRRVSTEQEDEDAGVSAYKT